VGEYGALSDNPGVEVYLQHVTEAFYTRYIHSALWAYNKADGGFAWLDASGQPKEVFQPAWGVPVPVRLPNRPEAMTPDFEAGSLEIVLRCQKDRLLEVLLPTTGAWQADIQPSNMLELAGQEDELLSLRCLQGGEVEVTIHP
jgi:hypothetical protein